MKKKYKVLITIGIILAVIIIFAICFILIWKPFGRTASKEVQKEYAERTQYFFNGVFHAPEDFTVMTLSELFVSRDLREYLLGRQYGHFKGSDYFRIKKTPEDKNGDGKIQSDEVTLDFIFNNRDNNPKKYFVDDYGNYHIGVQGVNDNLSLNNNNFTI